MSKEMHLDTDKVVFSQVLSEPSWREQALEWWWGGDVEVSS